MNNQVKQNHAPKAIKRVDVPKQVGEQVHANFNKGTAITLTDPLNGTGKEITKKVKDWLISFGWRM